jgi:hypothetical protein
MTPKISAGMWLLDAKLDSETKTAVTKNEY